MRTLCTIGYEGAQVEAFVYTLAAAGVDLVLDIRNVAGSRRPGFSKNALRENLALAQIQYVHLRNLGDPKEGREAARRGDYVEFRRVFSNQLATVAAQEDLAEAIRLASGHSIALLCYERDPKHCHRSIVAKTMTKQNAFAIRHLGVQSERRISDAKVSEVESIQVR